MNDRIKSALAALDKATPGPWDGSHEDGEVIGKNKAYIAAAKCYDFDSEEYDANLVLIAAAPDMARLIVKQVTLLKRAREMIAAHTDRCAPYHDELWLIAAIDELDKKD